MSGKSSSEVRESTVSKFQEQADASFEPRLAELGLSVAAIENQDLVQLRISLEKVNSLITNPNQLPSFRATTKSTSWLLNAEATYEVGPLPLLLKRKTLILDRIAVLGGQVQVSTLRDLVAEVADPEVQSRLRKEIAQLEEQSERYIEERREVENAKRAEEIRQQDLLSELQLDKERAGIERMRAEIDQMRAEITNRRSRVRAEIRQRLLEKESMASIVGAFLLVILTCTIIIAMFTATTVSSILSNGFLVVLGYFFGQTAARTASRGAGTMADESNRSPSSAVRAGRESDD